MNKILFAGTVLCFGVVLDGFQNAFALGSPPSDLGKIECEYRGSAPDMPYESCYGNRFFPSELERAITSAHERCFYRLQNAEFNGCWKIVRCSSGIVGCHERFCRAENCR